jgi:hypothetical protein
VWSVTTAQPVIWMDGASFSGGVWNNKMGGAGSGTTTGVATNTQTGSANGCNSTFPYISGGTGSGLEVGAAWPTGDFTLFHVTRYNGGTRQRIWNGKSQSTNWLSGHHGGVAGEVHHDQWVVTQAGFTPIPVDNWVITSDQRTLARINRGARTGTISSSANPGGNGINQYGGLNNNQRSDWACAEVVVFASAMSAADMIAVENYLYGKYGFTYF